MVDCGKFGGTLCGMARVGGNSGAVLSCFPRKCRSLLMLCGWKWHERLFGLAWCWNVNNSFGCWVNDML